MHTPESPEEDNVAVITRLTAHFICGSASDLLVVISKDWNQHTVLLMTVNVLFRDHV